VQLDLLYDIIRIQRDNQMGILADVQALCVRRSWPPPDLPLLIVCCHVNQLPLKYRARA
jgi:hypothetical protein